MKFMNAVSPSRSRSGPQGSSSEIRGSAKASGDAETDAGLASGSDGGVPASSGRDSTGAEDSSGGGVMRGVADSGASSGSGSGSGASEGSSGVAASAEGEGSAEVSAPADSGGSTGT